MSSPFDRLTPSLFEEPPVQVFTAKYQKQCLGRLEEQKKATRITSPCSSKSFMLDPEGRTISGGYIYTSAALLQLCKYVAPGLGQLILEVSGVQRPKGSARSEYNMRTAIDIFNKLVHTRYQRLSDKLLITDRGRKSIDGVVGASYKFLSNQDFMERIMHYVEPDRVFYEATLCGRNLLLKFIAPATRFTTVVGSRNEPYVNGLYFVNSEVGGSSVKAAAAILREGANESCIGQLRRVRHQGCNFNQQLERLISSVCKSHNTKLPIDKTPEAIYSLLAKKLLPQNREEEEQAKHGIMTLLVAAGLQRSFAKKILISSLITGAGHDPALPEMAEKQRLVLARRTYYDLFTAIMREAKGVGIDTREIAEHAAYRLLTGELLLASAE